MTKEALIHEIRMDHAERPGRVSAVGFCHSFGNCNSGFVIPLRVLNDMRIAQDDPAGRRQFELIFTTPLCSPEFSIAHRRTATPRHRWRRVISCAIKSVMEITLPLEQMTVAEKLRVMETLWADLTRDEENVPSPDWHEDILREREARLKSGEETPALWETAKQQLRQRLK